MKVNPEDRYSNIQEILDIINNSYSHPRAYDVYLECKKEIPNISLGTVYRNLNTLLESNSIQKIKSTDNIDRYDKMITEFINDGETYPAVGISFGLTSIFELLKNREEAKKFKLEPYIIEADLYSNKDLIGRGGWNWYTGSSSWFFKGILEFILGLKIENGYIRVEPCIASDWKEFEIRYKYKTSIF